MVTSSLAMKSDIDSWNPAKKQAYAWIASYLASIYRSLKIDYTERKSRKEANMKIRFLHFSLLTQAFAAKCE